MNLNLTFCSGLRCERKEGCQRWTVNLYRYLTRNEEDAAEQINQDTVLRVAQFADHEGKCEMFLEKEG